MSRKQEDIEARIESFIESERNMTSNPFIATRVMALIETDKGVQKSLSPSWQVLVTSFSLVAAIAGGITVGGMYKPASLSNSQTSVLLVNGETMEHFGFYQETSK